VKRASALVLAAALALAPGAGSAQSARASEKKLTPIIAELLAQPSAFVGKSVTIYGLVIEANAARTKFMLQDVSQQPLAIIGNGRLKAKAGDQVIVTGTVHVRGKDVFVLARALMATRVLGGGGCC
jgi:hypothetical protein